MQPDYKENGFDKEVRKYFLKILSSISWGVFLLMMALTLGIYYKLAFIGPNPVWYNILFYVLFLAGVVFYIFYLLRTWKKAR
jgi:vacuolar-type H+-ATPase subunit I/STV1